MKFHNHLGCIGIKKLVEGEKKGNGKVDGSKGSNLVFFLYFYGLYTNPPPKTMILIQPLSLQSQNLIFADDP